MMRLLSKNDAGKRIKKDNEELVDTNIRLRGIYKGLLSKINSAKLDYSPEKIQKQKEFDDFCKDLNQKRSRLLEEMNGIESEIERKKEIYYGLITKQDELEERIYQANEKDKKLSLREAFISDLEKKWVTSKN